MIRSEALKSARFVWTQSCGLGSAVEDMHMIGLFLYAGFIYITEIGQMTENTLMSAAINDFVVFGSYVITASSTLQIDLWLPSCFRLIRTLGK